MTYSTTVSTQQHASRDLKALILSIICKNYEDYFDEKMISFMGQLAFQKEPKTLPIVRDGANAFVEGVHLLREQVLRPEVLTLC